MQVVEENIFSILQFIELTGLDYISSFEDGDDYGFVFSNKAADIYKWKFQIFFEDRIDILKNNLI